MLPYSCKIVLDWYIELGFEWQANRGIIFFKEHGYGKTTLDQIRGLLGHRPVHGRIRSGTRCLCPGGRRPFLRQPWLTICLQHLQAVSQPAVESHPQYDQPITGVATVAPAGRIPPHHGRRTCGRTSGRSPLQQPRLRSRRRFWRRHRPFRYHSHRRNLVRNLLVPETSPSARSHGHFPDVLLSGLRTSCPGFAKQCPTSRRIIPGRLWRRPPAGSHPHPVDGPTIQRR